MKPTTITTAELRDLAEALRCQATCAPHLVKDRERCRGYIAGLGDAAFLLKDYAANAEAEAAEKEAAASQTVIYTTADPFVDFDD